MKERYFEKISFEQFQKDVADDLELYQEYMLPCRGSQNSAGYDFMAIRDVVLRPGEVVKIPTGYKAKFLEDEMLLLVIRSSIGIRHGLRMCNQLGIIDSDYYNNKENEGHMWVVLQNEGTEEYVLKKGTAYCQGIFVKYLTCGDEVDTKRVGGIGSTDKESRE